MARSVMVAEMRVGSPPPNGTVDLCLDQFFEENPYLNRET